MAEIKWNNVDGSGMNQALSGVLTADQNLYTRVRDFAKEGQNFLKDIDQNIKDKWQFDRDENTARVQNALLHADSLEALNQLKTQGLLDANTYAGQNIDLSKLNQTISTLPSDANTRALAKDTMLDYTPENKQARDELMQLVAQGRVNEALQKIPTLNISNITKNALFKEIIDRDKENYNRNVKAAEFQGQAISQIQAAEIKAQEAQNAKDAYIKQNGQSVWDEEVRSEGSDAYKLNQQLITNEQGLQSLLSQITPVQIALGLTPFESTYLKNIQNKASTVDTSGSNQNTIQNQKAVQSQASLNTNNTGITNNEDISSKANQVEKQVQNQKNYIINAITNTDSNTTALTRRNQIEQNGSAIEMTAHNQEVVNGLTNGESINNGMFPVAKQAIDKQNGDFVKAFETAIDAGDTATLRSLIASLPPIYQNKFKNYIKKQETYKIKEELERINSITQNEQNNFILRSILPQEIYDQFKTDPIKSLTMNALLNIDENGQYKPKYQKEGSNIKFTIDPVKNEGSKEFKTAVADFERLLGDNYSQGWYDNYKLTNLFKDALKQGIPPAYAIAIVDQVIDQAVQTGGKDVKDISDKMQNGIFSASMTDSFKTLGMALNEGGKSGINYQDLAQKLTKQSRNIKGKFKDGSILAFVLSNYSNSDDIQGDAVGKVLGTSPMSFESAKQKAMIETGTSARTDLTPAQKQAAKLYQLSRLAVNFYGAPPDVIKRFAEEQAEARQKLRESLTNKSQVNAYNAKLEELDKEIAKSEEPTKSNLLQQKNDMIKERQKQLRLAGLK